MSKGGVAPCHCVHATRSLPKQASTLGRPNLTCLGSLFRSILALRVYVVVVKVVIFVIVIIVVFIVVIADVLPFARGHFSYFKRRGYGHAERTRQAAES
jgi:hypothetical protein